MQWVSGVLNIASRLFDPRVHIFNKYAISRHPRLFPNELILNEQQLPLCKIFPPISAWQPSMFINFFLLSCHIS